MHCIILCGHSGGGKTRERMTNPTLKSLPYVDLGDVVADIKGTEQDTFGEMMRILAERIMKHEANTVVVEGHFLEASESRMWLATWAKQCGHTLEWREIKADIRAHVTNLMRDLRDGRPKTRDRMRQFKRDIRKYGI